MSKLTYTMFISFLVNTFLSVIKIVSGLFGKSASLIADGIHTFSDLSTDLISISQDNLDSESNEILERVMNLIIGLVILGLGLVIIYLSITKSIKIPSIWLVVISLFTIIIKFALASYVMEKGILYNNSVLINNARESDLDVISSVIVFLGLIMMQLSNVLPLFKYSDMIASVIVGLFVIKSGFDVLSHEINNIFGKYEEDLDYLDKITRTIKMDDNVEDINNISILKYGPYNELKVDLTLNDNLSLKNANIVAHNIEKRIKKYYSDIEYIVIRIK